MNLCPSQCLSFLMCEMGGLLSMDCEVPHHWWWGTQDISMPWNAPHLKVFVCPA